MNLKEIQDILDKQLLDRGNSCLNSAEILVLQGILQNKTYQEIAQQEGYSTSYFANVVAPELYRRLSILTEKRVTKKNCRVLLKYYLTEQVGLQKSASPKKLEQSSLHFQPANYPVGAVPLDSPFYIRQPVVERQILQEISQPGSLVRIKAPQEMGKTSLLLRILDRCEQELNYQTVSLNLEKVDQIILEDINQFLRWLCVNCARKLKLKPNLDEYWDEDIGCKMSWTIYFEEYILEEIDSQLILALDEVNHVFEHPKIAEDFLPLLRSCYEEARRLPIWQKLHLIIVHSTEIYVPLQLEQSPFNVGLPIELQSFNEQQVEQLAQKYQLNWKNNDKIHQLIDLVGGHPALIHLTLYYLSQEDITFEELLTTAGTASGIYSHHLQRHWVNLQEQPELAHAFQIVCNATESVSLDPIIAYKLNSMGLIHLEGNQASVSCRLYQDYFKNQWNHH